MFYSIFADWYRYSPLLILHVSVFSLVAVHQALRPTIDNGACCDMVNDELILQTLLFFSYYVDALQGYTFLANFLISCM